MNIIKLKQIQGAPNIVLHILKSQSITSISGDVIGFMRSLEGQIESYNLLAEKIITLVINNLIYTMEFNVFEERNPADYLYRSPLSNHKSQKGVVFTTLYTELRDIYCVCFKRMPKILLSESEDNKKYADPYYGRETIMRIGMMIYNWIIVQWKKDEASRDSVFQQNILPYFLS